MREKKQLNTHTDAQTLRCNEEKRREESSGAEDIRATTKLVDEKITQMLTWLPHLPFILKIMFQKIKIIDLQAPQQRLYINFSTGVNIFPPFLHRDSYLNKSTLPETSSQGSFFFCKKMMLFGKKIAFQENLVVSVDDHLAGEPTGGISKGCIGSDCCTDSMEAVGNCLNEKEVYSVEGEEEAEDTEQDHLAETQKETKEEEMTESSTNSKESPESDENPKTPSIDEDTATGKHPKNENDQSNTANSDPKTLKKPDKILPCPRCNSMDTKFCYYNNYNVNQPRHFCKSCQRYWTSGGTMRNVPVGAGRRKNKNSASHCRYITISEALQAAQFDASDCTNNAANGISGKVLTFGSDSPLYESMASTLNLADTNASNGNLVSYRRGENGDDCCSGSSGTTSNSMAERRAEPQMHKIHGFPSQVPCMPGVAWPYPWNSAVPFPAMCPSGLPMPYYPSPYWNCSVPGAWSNPWFPPPPPLSNQNVQGSEPYSPHLGKHSREDESQNPNYPEKEQKIQKNSVLIPKTLRIDDPDEAAKSSIWATLGIKNDSISSREGLFKAFQAKGEEKNHRVPNSPALQANPAALSRSLSFQERA